MKETLKKGFSAILTDLRGNIVPISVIIVLLIILRLIFHTFCPIVILTGFPCPGCGLTRACLHMITFHPGLAMSYNPTVIGWLPLLAVAIWLRYFKGISLTILRIPLLVLVLITFGVYLWRLASVFPGHEPMVFMPGSVFGRIHPGYDRAMMTLF